MKVSFDLRHLTVLGLAVFGLAASGCEKKAEPKKAEAAKTGAVNVAYVEATSQPLPFVISGSGTVTAWQEVPVGSEVGGLTAVAVLADEGQFVQKGQPLLRMNDVLLAAQYRQAEAQADQAKKAYNRAQEVFNKGFLSQAALDNAQSAYKTSAAALDTARTQLDMATVRAPVSGIVVSRKAVLGQIVNSGAELFRIVRDGAIEINLELTEDELHFVTPGQAVDVTSEVAPAITGRVRVITPEINAATRIGYARVVVPWSSGLRPGMFAKGTINGPVHQVVIVPSRSIIYNENKAGVFVLGPNNKARLVLVTVEQNLGDMTAITSGINAGDKVVTLGSGFLVDGDTVNPKPDATKIAPANAESAQLMSAGSR